MRDSHHFSVDVEEFFHASALESHIPQHHWEDLPRQSPQLIGRILDLMEEHGARGTFFVLGWLAEREPGMVKAIAAGGHEVSSHGLLHQRIPTLSRQAFQEDVRRSRRVLQDLTGQPVSGYRAPSFSIVPGSEWALDVLIEEGHSYDSSLFPIGTHPTYGFPGGRRDPHVLQRVSGDLVEVPPATLRVLGKNLPAAGGAYLRFFPLQLILSALRQASQRGQPGTLYVHPWEVDGAVPSFAAPALTQLRMRGGARTTLRKLRSLMGRFSFSAIGDTVATFAGSTRKRSQ